MMVIMENHLRNPVFHGKSPYKSTSPTCFNDGYGRYGRLQACVDDDAAFQAEAAKAQGTLGEPRDGDILKDPIHGISWGIYSWLDNHRCSFRFYDVYGFCSRIE